MSPSTRERVSLAAALIVTGAAFLLGIQWGLPSRAVDRFLFGDEPVWSGEKIAALAPSDSDVLGADVDANPINDRNRPTVLNQTDAQRAEIIRRYRLFSYQPDEMITFKSLAQIRAHRGDPRLYQYGGLWIYPVGGMLAIADLVGFVDLRGGPEGQAYYLDHPEAFGRFYVVARLYSAVWGLGAVWAVSWIVRRLTDDATLAAAAALAFAFMPVVVTVAHEAKPHLPGLALMLLAVVAATRYVETGRRRFALLAGGLCGAAFGMVVSALLAFAILPVMVLLRRESLRERGVALMLASATGLTVYVLTNPFVLINAVARPEILTANLGNSTAMYAVNLSGIGNAIKLLTAGATPIVLLAGMVGLVVMLLRRRNSGPLWLLGAPAALVTLQFILLAANKPPEYARFGLAPMAWLVIAGASALAQLPNRTTARVATCAVALLAATSGLRYVVAFMRDAAPPTSRLAAAEEIARRAEQGASSLRIFAEPAPYNTPPVNLFRYSIIFAPFPIRFDADVTLTVNQTQAIAPISWADTQFGIDPSRPTTAPAVSSAP